MKRMVFFIYGVVGYLLFLLTFAWLAGFVGNVLVPRSIDSPPSDSVPLSVVIDLGLIFLFGLQHSIMARPAFKLVWTRIVPQPIERSTYVFVSCAMTMLLIWQWRAIDLVAWDVRYPAGRWLLYGFCAAGWLLVPAVSLMIHHFDLFGTRQVWLNLLGHPYTVLPFRTPMLYNYVRHPLYVGWAIAFWATPTMTVGHLLFAAAMTVYMLLAVVFEERDLIAHYGSQYSDYKRRVPMFLPKLMATKKAMNKSPMADDAENLFATVSLNPPNGNVDTKPNWILAAGTSAKFDVVQSRPRPGADLMEPSAACADD